MKLNMGSNWIKLTLEGFPQGKNFQPLLKKLIPCYTLWVPTKYSLGMTLKKIKLNDRAYFKKWNVLKANLSFFETPIVTFHLLRRPTLAPQLP
jgi:hypothetical protein